MDNLDKKILEAESNHKITVKAHSEKVFALTTKNDSLSDHGVKEEKSIEIHV